MNIDLTHVILAIIAVIAGVAVKKLIPWIKWNATEKQLKFVDGIYKTLVFAAEQMFDSGKGSDKLDYVVAELEKRGFTVDRAKIEATVWEYLNSCQIEAVKYVE